MSIYEQKDIGEFFMNFLDRLQDGLGENKNLIRKVMSQDFKRHSIKVTNYKENTINEEFDGDERVDQMMKKYSMEERQRNQTTNADSMTI